MARRVSELRTAAKAGNTSREYLLLSNIDSNSSTKIALNDVFPTLQSGKATGSVTGATAATAIDLFVGGGVGSNTANTDKSILIFKGMQAEDTNGALSLRTDTSTADPNKQNIVVALDQRQIKLNLGDNSTANFLSETGGSNPLNLSTSTIAGTLPASRGGTGAATLTQGGILTGNGTGAVNAMASLGTASILVGAGTGNAPNELTVGTNNLVLIADSTSPLGVKWGKPTISSASFSTTLNMNNNNINLGTGYISGTGVGGAGLSLSNSTDYVYIGSGTKYFNSRLNVEGGITLGSYIGSSSQTIKQADCTAGASPALNITGSNNTDNNDGGAVNITAGDGQLNGDGGDLVLSAGNAAGTGTDGIVSLRTNNTVGLTVDGNQDVNVTENVTINQGKTLEWRGNETVTQLTSITTAVTLNASAGVIVLHATTISGHDSHYFTFNNSLINSRSIILLSCEVDGAEASGAGLTAQLADRAAGSVKIRVSNTGNATTTTNHAIHFLIMNVYV